MPIKTQSSVDRQKPAEEEECVDEESAEEESAEEASAEEELEQKAIIVDTEHKVVIENVILKEEEPNSSDLLPNGKEFEKESNIVEEKSSIYETHTTGTNEQDVIESLSHLNISEDSHAVIEDVPNVQILSTATAPSNTRNAPTAAAVFSLPLNQPQPCHQPAEPISSQTTNISNIGKPIQHENIRNQLQEIVSDIDRAVQDDELFTYPSTMRSNINYQNNTLEIHKSTAQNAILQPPSHFYQVCPLENHNEDENNIRLST